MKVYLPVFIVFSVVVFAENYRPRQGYVPDKETAVKIAEAVLVPVYGDKQIEGEKPFSAKLKNNVWMINGSLHCTDQNGKSTDMCLGGVAEVEISKTDGRIISMMHGK